MQNIFILSNDEKSQLQLKHRRPFQINERADFQYFTVICLIFSAKRDCKFTNFNFLTQQKTTSK
ncbi:hypothetical protein EB354_00120 [Chryseobacterium balustinum]|nr:hypothetical protein EB354_00120 [Chryseobacterium balustinum]